MKFMSWGAARTVQTTMPCKECGQGVQAHRACRQVKIYCSACKAQFPLDAYIKEMDDALEGFLENVFCDRV